MNIPVFRLEIFLIGCAGALAPEIVRLYRLRNNPRFSWSNFYLLISGLFALLGGFIAWILPATNAFAAFYAGVATPAIVTTIQKRRMATGEGASTGAHRKEDGRRSSREGGSATRRPRKNGAFWVDRKTSEDGQREGVESSHGVMVEEKDRKEYEEGLRDRSKGFIDQVVTDVSVDHPDSDAYYKGRRGEQLDDDKEGGGAGSRYETTDAYQRGSSSIDKATLTRGELLRDFWLAL